MGIFTRLKTGWSLARDSLRVLRHHPDLLAFPLVGGIAGLVYVGLLMGGAVLLTGPEPGPLMYAVLFVLYLGSTFIAVFFTAGLTYNVRETFEGREPTFRGGLAAAWDHRRPLFVWAVIAAIVGVILRAIEGADNPLADLAAAIFSVAWGILTYFVVPVIVFEDVGARGMIERSGETFKNTWGETAGAGFGVGIITVLFGLVGLALAALVFVLLGSTAVGLFGAIAVALVTVLFAALVGSALSSIAKTALYVYATEGKQPSEFEDVDFSRPAR
jgi:hypothetical protein